MNQIAIERVTDITDEIYAATESLVPHLASTNQVHISREYLERVAANDNHVWLVARYDGDIAGMASLMIMPMLTNVRANLENVVVDPKFRRKGIGLALCEAARTFADEHEVNTVRAAAFGSNEASKRMLNKAGFIEEHDMTYFELALFKGPRF